MNESETKPKNEIKDNNNEPTEISQKDLIKAIEMFDGDYKRLDDQVTTSERRKALKSGFLKSIVNAIDECVNIQSYIKNTDEFIESNKLYLLGINTYYNCIVEDPEVKKITQPNEFSQDKTTLNNSNTNTENVAFCLFTAFLAKFFRDSKGAFCTNDYIKSILPVNLYLSEITEDIEKSQQTNNITPATN